LHFHRGDVAAGFAGEAEADGSGRKDGGGDDDSRKTDKAGDVRSLSREGDQYCRRGKGTGKHVHQAP
jgi:hypothetical protein